MFLVQLERLPLRSSLIALAFGLGVSSHALAALAEHYYQCVGEAASARSGGETVKYVLNFQTGGSWSSVLGGSYSHSMGSRPGVLGGALACSLGDGGFPVCVPTPGDSFVHSFAVQRFGAYVSPAGETTDDGKPSYVGMDCVETSQEN